MALVYGDRTDEDPDPYGTWIRFWLHDELGWVRGPPRAGVLVLLRGGAATEHAWSSPFVMRLLRNWIDTGSSPAVCI